MKYIRVIDDLENEYLTTYIEHCEMVAELQDSGFDFEGGILKQANTIKELCDEFVVEFKHSEKQSLLHRDFDTLEEVYEFVNEHNGRCIIVSIKGAIWTDKGLIYVAKINDRGELELL